jgi:hypothetical protein
MREMSRMATVSRFHTKGWAKIFFGYFSFGQDFTMGRTQAQLKICLLERGDLRLFCLYYVVLNNWLAQEIWSTKVRILYFFNFFPSNLKMAKLTTVKM